jgi:hypothetical protein
MMVLSTDFFGGLPQNLFHRNSAHQKCVIYCWLQKEIKKLKMNTSPTRHRHEKTLEPPDALS